MAHIILEQPDGKFAIWSTIIDDFVEEGMTRKEVIAFETKLDAEASREKWEGKFDENGRLKANASYGMTYEEALDRRAEVHADVG